MWIFYLRGEKEEREKKTFSKEEPKKPYFSTTNFGRSRGKNETFFPINKYIHTYVHRRGEKFSLLGLCTSMAMENKSVKANEISYSTEGRRQEMGLEF
jgi:hypothetical protein